MRVYILFGIQYYEVDVKEVFGVFTTQALAMAAREKEEKKEYHLDIGKPGSFTIQHFEVQE